MDSICDQLDLLLDDITHPGGDRRAPFHESQQQKSHHQSDHKPAIIVISGPTATGKSHFALKLARLLCGEIISADSMQVYRGMDIGTSKPSLGERQQAPHHLIDIRNVSEPINAAYFAESAEDVISSCIARGRLPIVVGGSGFYIQALMQGPPPGPSADPFVRAHLEGEIERLGAEHLYLELSKQDPAYAKTISSGDRQKIIRAFEIMILTQKRVSEHTWSYRPSPYRFLPYFFFRPRAQLYDRIEKRCDQMLSAGLLEEVQRLIDEGLLENPSAMQAIGYRQSLEFFKTRQAPDDYLTYVQNFKRATRHYAKRQFTWFRKQENFTWIDMTAFSEQALIERIFKDYTQQR